MKTLIYNIGVLATPKGTSANAGEKQRQITFLENAYILCENGLITQIGTGEPPTVDAKWIDAEGKLVTPGLIDAHTHLVFGGWREHELAMKRRGVPYLEILAQGGGILSTVKMTRAASEDELTDKAKQALKQMLSLGVTTCEAKSGYGLDAETERKQLRVIQRLSREQQVELVATYLGAHAVPTEYKQDPERYLSLMEALLPSLAEEGLAEFCDVFCETGVFDAEQSVRILSAAKECGLKPKMHACRNHVTRSGVGLVQIEGGRRQ